MRVILASAFVATVLATAPARADSFVEVAGGISIPLSDDEWTDRVESSPLIALRAGAFPNEIGGYVSAGQLTEADALAEINGAIDTWSTSNSAAYKTAERQLAAGIAAGPRPWEPPSRGWE